MKSAAPVASHAHAREHWSYAMHARRDASDSIAAAIDVGRHALHAIAARIADITQAADSPGHCSDEHLHPTPAAANASAAISNATYGCLDASDSLRDATAAHLDGTRRCADAIAVHRDPARRRAHPTG